MKITNEILLSNRILTYRELNETLKYFGCDNRSWKEIKNIGRE